MGFLFFLPVCVVGCFCYCFRVSPLCGLFEGDVASPKAHALGYCYIAAIGGKFRHRLPRRRGLGVFAFRGGGLGSVCHVR